MSGYKPMISHQRAALRSNPVAWLDAAADAEENGEPYCNAEDIMRDAAFIIENLKNKIRNIEEILSS